MNSLLLAAGSVGTVLIAYAIYMISRPRHVRQQIAQDVLVDNEWQILTSDRIMRTNRKRQRIELSIDGLKLDVESGEMFLDGGDVIEPQLKISDIDGHWLELEGGSAGVGTYDPATSPVDVSSLSFRAQFTPNSVFKAVMIRSDVPFTCSSISWTNYVCKK